MKGNCVVAKCPVCDSERIAYEFIINQKSVCSCEDCSHLFVNSQNECKAETIEKIGLSSNPQADLIQIHKKHEHGEQLSFYLSVINSKAAMRNKQKWEGFGNNTLQFFSTETIQNLLCKCGFEQIRIKTADDNGVNISCTAGEIRKKKVISIIIPVYNEENTVLTLLNNIAGIKFEELDKELIIIESNSTDKTRDLVKDFVAQHSDIKFILEEKPRGKGHAVRSGFNEATGDFIAIQDGDLEYDVNDYDKLILPLIRYQKAFVLGSRHTGDWKMRNFGTGRKVLSAYVNFGHVLLTALINIGCGVKLKDPFTMYKLFRRECLYGLRFDGNRFEIDWEIVIKLIRKGFIPAEIPVNYTSRDFKAGKKILMFRDPIICVKSFFKYRYFYKMDA